MFCILLIARAVRFGLLFEPQSQGKAERLGGKCIFCYFSSLFRGVNLTPHSEFLGRPPPESENFPQLEKSVHGLEVPVVRLRLGAAVCCQIGRMLRGFAAASRAVSPRHPCFSGRPQASLLRYTFCPSSAVTSRVRENSLHILFRSPRHADT